MEGLKRLLSHPTGWLVFALLEFAALIVLNRLLADIIGGSGWEVAVVLLVLEVVALTVVNFRVRTRLLR